MELHLFSLRHDAPYGIGIRISYCFGLSITQTTTLTEKNIMVDLYQPLGSKTILGCKLASESFKLTF